MWLLFGALATAWLGPAECRAQAGKFKADDAVQVHFLGQWRDAKVLQTNARGEVLAEFEFANTRRSQKFRGDQVRFIYEQGALTPLRAWSDLTGSFRIKAVLLELQAEAVVLRTPEMTELTVPIAKLSNSDQSFIQRLEKQLGPLAGRAPPASPVLKFNTAGAAVVGGPPAQPAPLTLDPSPPYQRLAQGGMGFPVEDPQDRLGAVIALGGEGSLVLAAVESENRSAPRPTRLVWVSLERQKVEGIQALPNGSMVLDYHPPSRRLLTFTPAQSGEEATPATLSVWEVLPADKVAAPVVRWDAETDRFTEPWARLVTGNVVLHRWKKQEYVGWDISAKKMAFRIEQESFFAPLPELSGGRKYLFMPEDKRVRVFDSATGQPLLQLPADDGVAAVAVSEDGRRAAVLSRSKVAVWDLSNPAQPPYLAQAESVGTPFRANIRWVGNDKIMVDGHHNQVLFSLTEKLALWNYQFDMSAVLRESGGRRLRDIVDNHLVYGAAFSNGGRRGLAVGAVKLPGPKVEETVAAFDREARLLMKSGSAVRLDVRCGEHSSRVEQALTKAVEAAGWVLQPSATATLTATMSRGEQQTTTYRMIGPGGGGDQSVTVTPFISNLRLLVGETVAWQSGTSSGAPPFIRLEANQSVQQEVNKWQRPNPEFFDRVKIPTEVSDPKLRNGLGSTKVTTRGLEPVE